MNNWFCYDLIMMVITNLPNAIRSDLNQLTEGDGSPCTKQPRTTETPPPPWTWSDWQAT